jgi:lipopolysaccharide/colanic/teichoic acid biosynthesis glycosyltransferase
MAACKPYCNWVKRPLDLLVAAAAVGVCSPLLAAIALAVRWRLGSPVLFAQPRAGRDGRAFRCLKFRTMADARDADGALLPDERRLTRFGRWLRSTSLDELPELWNVLRGEMSLVGPRPLLVEYLDHYTPEQARRHEVRPGITGLAQVSGRNALDWPRRLELDVQYVNNVSLRLDVRILWRTVATVLSRRGVSAPGHATAPRFDRADNGERRHVAA